ncbi:hypothetical protein FBY35_4049 [Streptomyces sp. SLBN-118]|uniref:hypothetical protein n=1 Tax=Streptomyces sp. SLBN-118 TaxID=2768454 RepID=UPI001150A5FE|nr:hypothetical protein [Streptomyces sp. SLBN-118]TQK42621.1 hypothetical protein FBY35_4049 [Streptomyces sp. SLBN-118]
MNGITLTLRALHLGEQHLARELLTAAERHRAEHEVHHVAIDLSRWSHEHASRIAEASRDHGLNLADPPQAPHRALPSLAAAADEETAGAPGSRLPPDLRLLYDLRHLHLMATGNSLYWEMLVQGAQAAHEDALLQLASSCRPRTLRQIRWTNTMIKNLAPQALQALH